MKVFLPVAMRFLALLMSAISLGHSRPSRSRGSPPPAARLCELTEEEENATGFEKLRVVCSDVPAITHVDNSARIQTVDKKDNPLYHRLIERFYEKTGCPVIINTSFNVRGEPIVRSPEEAYTCFMRTRMDYLVMGNFLLDKKEQEKLFAPEEIDALGLD